MDNVIIYKTEINDFNKYMEVDHFMNLCYEGGNKIVTLSANGSQFLFARVDIAKPKTDLLHMIYWELVEMGDTDIPEELLA